MATLGKKMKNNAILMKSIDRQTDRKKADMNPGKYITQRKTKTPTEVLWQLSNMTLFTGVRVFPLRTWSVFGHFWMKSVWFHWGSSVLPVWTPVGSCEYTAVPEQMTDVSKAMHEADSIRLRVLPHLPPGLPVLSTAIELPTFTRRSCWNLTALTGYYLHADLSLKCQSL